MNKKMNYILLLFLILQPFLDVIATTSFNKINVIVRGAFLVFVIIYLIKNKKHLNLLVPLFVVSLILFIYNYKDFGLMNSISSVMKVLYLPLILIFFSSQDKNDKVDKYLVITLSIYLILFLSSYLFGFGFNNYQDSDGKSGFRGIFNSINEISAIIIALLPIALHYLKNNKKIILQILYILMAFFVSLLTGTKVLMIGLFIILLFVYYQDIIHLYRSLNKPVKVISLIVVVLFILLGCYLLTYTRFYQNMLIQNEFFKVTNIKDFINKILFNDRLTFLSDNYKYYINQNILTKLLGIGYLNDSIKLVEMDIFDILFRYGIVGLIGFCLPILLTIRNIKVNKIQMFSIILLVLISITSGHVLLSPSVCIYFGYFILSKEM